MNLLLWTAGATEKEIPLIKKLAKMGFDGIEFPMFDPKGSPWAKLGVVLDDLGLGRTAVSVNPQGANLIGDSAKERKAAVDHFKACVDACESFGAEMLCGPLVSPVGRLVGRGPNAAEWARATEGLRAAGAHAEGTGVTLIVEALNRFESYFPNSQADLSKLIDAVGSPAVAQMYDTFHANIEEKDIAKAVRTGGKRIKHVHISANDRATPGEDHIDYKTTFAALHKIRYNGWLTIEAFGGLLPELAGATCIWRSMYKNEDQLARDGLKFIKKNW